MRATMRLARAMEFYKWRNLIAHWKVIKAPTFRPFHLVPKPFVHPGLLERLLKGVDKSVHLTVEPKNYREGEDRYIMRWEGAGER